MTNLMSGEGLEEEMSKIASFGCVVYRSAPGQLPLVSTSRVHAHEEMASTYLHWQILPKGTNQRN